MSEEEFLKEKDLLLNSIENNTKEHWQNYYKDVPIECIYDDLVIDINEIKRLTELNKSLNKQLENCFCNRTDCSGRIKDSKQYDSLVQKVENQQKEFVEYLEDKINKLKEQIKNYDIWHEVGMDINFLILKKQFYLEILQKYKEIIGVSDDKTN